MWSLPVTQGVREIGSGLEANTTLEELDLTENNIGKDGAQLLGQAMAKNRSVRRLWLDKNKLDDDAMGAFFNEVGCCRAHVGGWAYAWRPMRGGCQGKVVVWVGCLGYRDDGTTGITAGCRMCQIGGPVLQPQRHWRHGCRSTTRSSVTWLSSQVLN